MIVELVCSVRRLYVHRWYIAGDCGTCVYVPLGCMYIAGDFGTCVLRLDLGCMYIAGTSLVTLELVC